MARRKGSVNYKNDALIKIIGEILPNGEYGWDAVAAAYQKVANEETLRDSADLKKHWIKNLCNNMKKPTGGTGERGDRINRCIAIERKIMEKTNSGLLGFSSEEDTRDRSAAATTRDEEEEEEEGDDEEEEGRGDDEEGRFLGEDADMFLADTASATTDTVVPPAPLNDNESVTPAGPTNVTPAGPTDNVIRAALKKAGSTLKVSKTKNSSNKNKERTSIAGAIVKLIEQSAAPASSATNIGATATMTLLRQMERMNDNMDKRDRREKRERRKRRKKIAKRKAKKKARKKAKKQAALLLQDDHGGKAGGDSSSSSSSSSSEESDSSDSDSSDSEQSSHYGKGSWRHAEQGSIEK